MTNDDIEIIGKNVKDMYGTFMGKVIGTITDIEVFNPLVLTAVLKDYSKSNMNN